MVPLLPWARPPLSAHRHAKPPELLGELLLHASHDGSRSCNCSLFAGGPHSERMTDRIRQLGSIQRIEVEIAYALALQLLHLLDRNPGGNQSPGIRVIIQPVEPMLQPLGDGCAPPATQPQHLPATP